MGRISARAYVAPHSVVMNDEHLLPGARNTGAPSSVLDCREAIGVTAGVTRCA